MKRLLPLFVLFAFALAAGVAEARPFVRAARANARAARANARAAAANAEAARQAARAARAAAFRAPVIVAPSQAPVLFIRSH